MEDELEHSTFTESDKPALIMSKVMRIAHQNGFRPPMIG